MTTRMQACAAALLLLLAAAMAIAPARAAPAEDAVRDLARMSLEELASVEVMSVARTPQALSDAPASVYVITREEILRTGVRSIPEALRLAPNLQVRQLNASEYEISARGLGGAPDLQNFPNKILILIDGRSVYSPLFSGVYYDAQDVFMDDIERIEVVSGPGGTLWGANAMHGVINIITRAAAETVGGRVRAAAGNREQGLGARYGGKLDDRGHYRVYAKTFSRGAERLDDGRSAGDDWRKVQAGFRIDLERGGNQALTFQGDAWTARQDQAGAGHLDFSGVNALGRWSRTGRRSETQVQAYVDRTERSAPGDGVAFDLNTFDVEFQQLLRLGRSHSLVWGAGHRLHRYDIANSPALAFQPPRRSLQLSHAYAQDTIALARALKLALGLKLEDNPYSGRILLPDASLSWSPRTEVLVWGRVARGIRSPTPFDVDVTETVDGMLFLVGNPRFREEDVTAWEIGYRGQPSDSVSYSITAFFHDYDELRTIEIDPDTLLPLRWGNSMEGESWGFEGWANLQLTDWWRLSPGFRTLKKRLDFTADSTSPLLGLGVEQAGNDPDWEAMLKSSMDVGCCLSFDAVLRRVDELPDPQLSDYYELTARLGWRISDVLELSVTGLNLLRSDHREYPDPNGLRIRRSVFAEARWTF